MSFARKVIPAVVLGGVAVGAVVLLDPAINGRDSQPMADQATLPAIDPSSPASSSAPASSSPSASASASASSSPSASASDSTAAAGPCEGPSQSGQQIMTRYGAVQVAGTVKNGKLCEVHAVAWPEGDHRSSQINAQAVPTLDKAATAYVQGNGKFQYVSGATYTSDGYAQSLQSLLDSL